MKKIGIPPHTPVLLYKSGVQARGYTLHGHAFVILNEILPKPMHHSEYFKNPCALTNIKTGIPFLNILIR